MKKLYFTLLYFTLLSVTSVFSQEYTGVVVRLNHKLLNLDLVDSNVRSFKFKDIFNSIGIKELNQLNSGLDFNLLELDLSKIFPNFKTKDSISIGRQGNVVYVPPFWATFKIIVPDRITISDFSKSLRSMYPLVIYVDPPIEIIFNSTPNDTLYPYQLSLLDSMNSISDINIDSAWTIETGKSFIKVGVFDSGIDSLHPDIDVVGGYSYFNDLLPDSTNSYLYHTWGRDILGHGTPVAGIIGAKRNNQIGVAGIAGGNGTDTSGVSLFDFNLGFYEGSDTYHISQALIDASRSVGSYYDWGIGTGNINDEYYWRNAPGYGIYVGNHSYSSRVIQNEKDIPNPDTTAWEPPPIEYNYCSLCRESYLFSLQNGVVNVVSRGNNFDSSEPESPNDRYPALYHDSWVINVGASGKDGKRVDPWTGNTDITENYWSPIGNNIDILAPGVKALVVSTQTSFSQDTIVSDGFYTRFNGTSASAPHVTGVASLLLSYYNKPCYNNRNLDPADVEYIIEHSATHLSPNIPNDSSGWGRLNAHEALKMIDYPRLQIVHPNNDPVYSQQIEKDTITLRIYTPLNDMSGGPLASSFPMELNLDYLVERYKYEVYYDFSQYILPTTTVLDTWVRHSQTNSLAKFEDTTTLMVGSPAPVPVFTTDELEVEPMAVIDTVYNNSFIRLEGYYYHFIGRYYDTNLCCGVGYPITPVDYWYPVNPTQTTPKMAFSIYIEDSTLTSLYDFPCDSSNVFIDSLASLGDLEYEEDFLLFPNPSSNEINVVIPEELLSKGTLRLCDLNGSIVQEINVNSDRSKYVFNVSHLKQGIYFAIYGTNNINLTKKWIKL